MDDERMGGEWVKSEWWMNDEWVERKWERDSMKREWTRKKGGCPMSSWRHFIVSDDSAWYFGILSLSTIVALCNCTPFAPRPACRVRPRCAAVRWTAWWASVWSTASASGPHPRHSLTPRREHQKHKVVILFYLFLFPSLFLFLLLLLSSPLFLLFYCVTNLYFILFVCAIKEYIFQFLFIL